MQVGLNRAGKVVLFVVKFITIYHNLIDRPTLIVIFMRESSFCFQRVLAVAILSVRLSVCHTGGSVKNGAC